MARVGPLARRRRATEAPVRRREAVRPVAPCSGRRGGLGARQVRLAEDAARRAERGGGGLVVEDADVGVFQEAAPSAAPRPPPPDSAESYPVLESAAAPGRRRLRAAQAARAVSAPRPVWKSASAGHGDGAAMLGRAARSRQRRKARFPRRRGPAAGTGRTTACSRGTGASRTRSASIDSAPRKNGRAPALVLWAQRTLATHADGLAGAAARCARWSGSWRGAARRTACRCRRRATLADSTRAAEVAALYGSARKNTPTARCGT